MKRVLGELMFIYYLNIATECSRNYAKNFIRTSTVHVTQYYD